MNYVFQKFVLWATAWFCRNNKDYRLLVLCVKFRYRWSRAVTHQYFKVVIIWKYSLSYLCRLFEFTRCSRTARNREYLNAVCLNGQWSSTPQTWLFAKYFEHFFQNSEVRHQLTEYSLLFIELTGFYTILCQQHHASTVTTQSSCFKLNAVAHCHILSIMALCSIKARYTWQLDTGWWKQKPCDGFIIYKCLNLWFWSCRYCMLIALGRPMNALLEQ